MLLTPNLDHRYFGNIETKVNKSIHHLLEKKIRGLNFWGVSFLLLKLSFMIF